MSSSYREIDYRIRPGKYAERLMMIEAFRRLKFATVESYQYVGLGSVYFSDFSLIHRSLGISKMVSIEKNEHDKARFIDNIPYSCIEMLWGDAVEKLPSVNLGARSIVWLDYDGRLSRPMLGDIAEVSSRAASGSVLAVTVQCRFDNVQKEDGTDGSVAALADALGASRVPHDLKTKDIRGDGTAKLYRKVIIEEIERALSARNAVLAAPQHMRCRQILNFRYEDGVKMMTVGVVIYDAGQAGLFELCGFGDLSFVRQEEASFDIAIPKLTPKEIKRLEAQMPVADPSDIQRGSIPERDANQYAKMYRYFPNIAFVD